MGRSSRLKNYLNTIKLEDKIIMKEFYNKPEIEITMFETEDIITTSSEFGDNDFDEGNSGWG